MVDIKKDLDQYLLLKTDTKKSFKQVMKTPIENIKGWFPREDSREIASKSFIQRLDCFPKLVS